MKTTTFDESQWKLMPVERSYDMRVKALIAFNSAEQSGKDRDDALEAAYLAMLAAAPASTADDSQAATERAVIQPLKEPVSINKALLAGRAVTVSSCRESHAAFLVNIQMTGWNHTKEWTEGFAKGFNDAAALMQSAMTAHFAQPVADDTGAK